MSSCQREGAGSVTSIAITREFGASLVVVKKNVDPSLPMYPYSASQVPMSRRIPASGLARSR